jgi:hypothetical protein
VGTQPLNLKCDIPVSNFAAFKCNLYRYTEAVHDARRNAAANNIANATFRRGDLAKLKASLPGLRVGLDTFANPVVTHSLKAPGFNA